jgi:hypothetical protein
MSRISSDRTSEYAVESEVTRELMDNMDMMDHVGDSSHVGNVVRMLTSDPPLPVVSPSDPLSELLSEPSSSS